MRILIIEDEPDLLRVLSQILRESGYAVDLAANGRAGLLMATSGNYDAILLDLMLPEMDGYTVLAELRHAKTTPVLVLTARDAVTDRVRGLEIGADDYMIKPFEIPELLARVHALIRRGEGGAISIGQSTEITAATLARTAMSLNTARKIQRQLMPQTLPSVPGVELVWHYVPAQVVGGDYCDVWTLPDGSMAFAVGDVAGKGVPAAIVMSNLQASLRAGAAFCCGPAETVEYVNRHLSEHLPDGLFVTLFFGLLDPNSGQLEYVNAGHVPPLAVLPEGTVETVGSPVNPVLGISTDPFVAQCRTLRPGEMLLVVTDGITESESAQGEMLGVVGLRAAVEGSQGLGADQMVQRVVATASTFRDTCLPQDDETVLAVGRPKSELTRGF